MKRIKIVGGNTLTGTINISGAKNSAVALIPAAILSDEQVVIDNIPKGLCACIYTQLSDVEDELNGFVTFDREVVKIYPEKIKWQLDKIKY